MNFSFLMVIISGLIVRADDAAKDTAKQDLDQLQGTWVRVGGEAQGQPISQRVLEDEHESVIIKGHNFTHIRDDVKAQCMIRLNPSKKPAWLDLIVPGQGELKGYTNHAIYSLEGDKLTICVSRKYGPNTPEQRPIKFTSNRGDNKNLSGLVMTIYKRQKK